MAARIPANFRRVITLFLMPETRKMSIWDADEKALSKS